jgi:hypothetical protein
MGFPRRAREDYRVPFTDKEIGLINATRVATTRVDSSSFLPSTLPKLAMIASSQGRASRRRSEEGATRRFALVDLHAAKRRSAGMLFIIPAKALLVI